MNRMWSRNFALGFFTGSAAIMLAAVFQYPEWLAAALVVSVVLLVGGLGAYLVYLVQSLTDDLEAENPGRPA